MTKPDTAATPKQQSSIEPAAEHIAEAHRLLTTLRDRLDQHPELEQAIEKLEMALSALTLKSGGLL
jgi:predicted translin family RNA/ssDNA-binding protein